METDLEKKSEENLEIARYALGKEYYHIVISRIYFAIYQTILAYMWKYDLKSSDDMREYLKKHKIDPKKGSYSNTISAFCHHYNNHDLSYGDISTYGDISKIRQYRNKVEYQDTDSNMESLWHEFLEKLGVINRVAIFRKIKINTEK
ncbi:hypothetical protein P0082_11920 [Candidatus Haliotispira prima]|uniref:HEPN domain-containing protein n=1 Tax=Candidatus Haliotispira prima TaxID=3034016 RepID=A0ABY8MGS8_9SPIO|nr:hypothetical protein P0082_11920 [Candidatus Haliotispira prima]